MKFKEWKNNLVTDPDIMGGETCFPNSRLSVNKVAKMMDNGESIKTILEDYPYLTEKDCEYAVQWLGQERFIDFF